MCGKCSNRFKNVCLPDVATPSCLRYIVEDHEHATLLASTYLQGHPLLGHLWKTWMHTMNLSSEIASREAFIVLYLAKDALLLVQYSSITILNNDGLSIKRWNIACERRPDNSGPDRDASNERHWELVHRYKRWRPRRLEETVED